MNKMFVIESINNLYLLWLSRVSVSYEYSLTDTDFFSEYECCLRNRVYARPTDDVFPLDSLPAQPLPVTTQS